jgi:UDP-N-acetylglucosamine 2-epimerase (non-hydrolysing)
MTDGTMTIDRNTPNGEGQVADGSMASDPMTMTDAGEKPGRKRKTVITFSNVTKVYKLYKNDKRRLLSVFSKKVTYTEKKAVDGVTFRVKQGESVALFGRNGAGKSTILKMITGVAYPTVGKIAVNGRVSALLELTAGFDMEMTGRENIYLRSQLLGVKDSETAEREDEIVDFAELEEYIDQPVRTYSSGMKARLGFAINVSIEPEIFVVDEALSVGDSAFKDKCVKKVREIIDRDNVTLLFVTHAPAMAKEFCRRGIVLKDGRVVCDADIETASEAYEEISSDRKRGGRKQEEPAERGSGQEKSETVEVAERDDEGAVRKRKILAILNARPEAVKMCSVIHELRSRPGFDVAVCVTGHTGRRGEIPDQILDRFGVTPDYDLHITEEGQAPEGRALFDIINEATLGAKTAIESARPDLVLVHDGTTATLAAALAAFYLGVPVGHVEAGIRTYDIALPYPDEYNRQAIDSLTKFFFASSSPARQRLLDEHKAPYDIYMTGNITVDAFRVTVESGYAHPELDWAKDAKLVLLIARRKENVGEPMKSSFTAIKRVVERHEDVKVIYPAPLNPDVRRIADETFGGSERIRIIEPLDVCDFHNFMNRSFLILTDDGAIQEEAPSLGKPVLVLSDRTERPEGVRAGTLKVVGTEERAVSDALELLLTDESEYERMSRAPNPYGDGKAGARIADALEDRL